jgi:hypothetical protein
MKKIFIIIIILLVGAGVLVYLYFDNKLAQENADKAQEILSEEEEFSDFYQKSSNKFCADKNQTELEQENIIKDMLWELELEQVEARKIKRIKCDDGSQGILIK